MSDSISDNDLRTQLACCADLVNSWCRETGIAECSSPYVGLQLRDAVDRLWSTLSGRWHSRTEELQRKLDAAESRAADADRMRQRIERLESKLDAWHDLYGSEDWRSVLAAEMEIEEPTT